MQTLTEKQTPSHVRYWVVAFLCALSFLTYFDRVSIMRAQPEIQGSLSLTNDQMGLVMSAFWLSYGLFEIPSGFIGDRFGPKLALIRIVLAWSLFTALTGVATGFVSLVAFRFMFGVGEAGAFPNMAAVQARWLPVRERARAGGIVWLFARWGGAFSPLIFGAILRMMGSKAIATIPGVSLLAGVAPWRVGFFISGLLGLVWCAAFQFWFRDNPAEKAGVNSAEVELIGTRRTGSDHGGGKEMWWALITSPSVWALSILYFSSSFGWSFFLSWMPRYLKDVHHVEFEKSEFISALPLFCGGITCVVGGYICDYLVRRTGRRRLVRAIFPVTGCCVAAISMYGIHFTTTPMQATILMCVAAGAYDFGQAANWASIVDIGGQYSGTSAGFINMISNLGHAAQTAVGAWIFDNYGWGVLFAVYSAAYLIAASMWLFIDPTKPFYEPKPEVLHVQEAV